MNHDPDPSPPPDMTRRTFVKLAAAAGLAATVTPVWAAEVKNDMLYRSLGNTGEKISALGLGGYHIGIQGDEAESLRLVRTAWILRLQVLLRADARPEAVRIDHEPVDFNIAGPAGHRISDARMVLQICRQHIARRAFVAMNHEKPMRALPMAKNSETDPRQSYRRVSK